MKRVLAMAPCNSWNPLLKIVIGWLFIAAIGPAAQAQCVTSGCLDASFGVGGIASTTLMTQVAAIAEFPSTSAQAGKILTVGLAGTQTTAVRWNSNGTLDIPYARNANAQTTRAVAIQPDGKAIVVGSAGGSMYVERYNEDGTFDATFGQNGIVYSSCGKKVKSGCELDAVALQADGKIVAAGAWPNGLNIRRFTSTGAIDSSFGVSGTSTLPNYWDQPIGIALQQVSPTDTRILVSGAYTASSRGYWWFGVARLTANGTLDSSFGSNGITYNVAAGFGARPAGVSVDSAGRIVQAGWAANSATSTTLQSNYDFAAARFLSDGAIDTSFAGGWVSVDLRGDRDLGYAMGFQADGSVLAGGLVRSPGTNYNASGIARWTSTGVLDTTFNAQGSLPGTVINDSMPDVHAMLVLSNGMIVTGGSLGSPPSMAAIARYLP